MVVRLEIAAVIVGAIVALGAVWYVRGPGPLAFTGGKSVALADYRDGDPTGVPVDMRQASLLERGKYLTEAADCVVCHTAHTQSGPYLGVLCASRKPNSTIVSPTAYETVGVSPSASHPMSSTKGERTCRGHFGIYANDPQRSLNLACTRSCGLSCPAGIKSEASSSSSAMD